jgi:nickel-dependent lactate racemase
LIGKGHPGRFLTQEEITTLVSEGLPRFRLNDKRLLVIIPDGTRTMPMPAFFDLFEDLLMPKVRQLDYLVALGTHRPMSDGQLSRLLGRDVLQGRVAESHVFNHAWSDPATFTQIGTIPAKEIREFSGGLLNESVPVRLNKRILDYDSILICGPVFPHEVVGFSGGNKYLFPGVAGAEIINFTHWLGALITNFETIGRLHTPVRAVIDRAAAFVKVPVSCLSLVVTHAGVNGLYCGEAREAWQAAADLSSQVHITYKEKAYQKVLSIMPDMYDDLWTAAKGAYKLEPIVADGGEIIIYAPRVKEVSYTHGQLIDEIGYHCRDYFLKQWERFKGYPGSVLAHSTHVKGLGTYDATTGIESPRIRITLATGIPASRCRQINLGYLDPASIEVHEWQGREQEGVLVVPRAGETLYRLK